MPAVARTPTCPLDVDSAAARAPGSITPTTGTADAALSDGNAAADAELHATTSAFTSR